MWPCQALDLTKYGHKVIEIDDKDWERWQAFKRVAAGWDAFIRDLDQPGEAHGPRTK